MEEKKVPNLRFEGFTDDWEQCKLGEVYDVTMGQSPNSENYYEHPNGEVLVQGNADIQDGKIVPRIWTTQTTKIAPPNTIILTVRAPVGEVAISEFKVVLGRGVAAINGSKFVYYYLQRVHKKGLWKRLSTGSTFESINSMDINNARINIPSESEQRLVADFLDRLDNLITLYKRKLELLEELKRHLLDVMFADEETRVPELRFEGFDGEWKWHKLGDVAEINYGYTPSTKEPDNFGNDYTWFSVTDMNSKYISESNRKLSKKGFRKDKLIPKNTLLMSFKLTIGKCAITTVDCLTNEAIANFTWEDNSDTEFMYYRLESTNVLKYGNRAAQGITLNSDSLNSIRFYKPSIEEQKQISMLLSELDRLITLYTKKSNSAESLKEFLLDNMFV